MKSFFTTVLILLIVAAGVYYYFQLDKAADLETQSLNSESLQQTEDTTPEIQHPVTESPATIGDSAGETPAETETEEPLPPLEESDNRIKEILSELVGNDLVNQFFKQTGIIHRFVVTVDSLPKKEVPLKYRLLPPTKGKFLVHKDSSEIITLDPDNYVRYDIYMQLLDRLDTEQFVKWYTRFYPLIQEDYDSLGYKNRYFNDRLIFVIDHLLETPEATGSIELVQPNVFYQFADPALQNLSAGRKILLRIGPANSAIVKAKLIEIRKRLASPQ